MRSQLHILNEQPSVSSRISIRRDYDRSSRQTFNNGRSVAQTNSAVKFPDHRWRRSRWTELCEGHNLSSQPDPL